MPQKKNPDVAELARGTAGRLIGDLTALLTVLKGLPLAYDRDLQEDKEPVFDAVDTLLLVLPAVSGMIATMTVNVDRLESTAADGYALATDVAELLVRRGIAFRDAHEAVGELVAYCATKGLDMSEVDDATLTAINVHLTPEVRDVLSVRGALEARSAPGGTAPARVADQLADLRETVHRQLEWAATQ
jgi:argininosuccinate lyase